MQLCRPFREAREAGDLKLAISWLTSRLSKASKDICFCAEILKKSIPTSSFLSLFLYHSFLPLFFIMETQSFELSFSIIDWLQWNNGHFGGRTMKIGDIGSVHLLFIRGINLALNQSTQVNCASWVLH